MTRRMVFHLLGLAAVFLGALWVGSTIETEISEASSESTTSSVSLGIHTQEAPEKETQDAVSLPDPKDLTAFVSAVSELDPARIESVLNGLLGDSKSSSRLEALLGYWMNKNPGAAIVWLAQRPAGWTREYGISPTRYALYELAGQHIASFGREAALNYLNSYDGTGLDAVARLYFSTRAESNPREALDTLNTMPHELEEKLGDQWLLRRAIVDQWLVSDPRAAMNYIEMESQSETTPDPLLGAGLQTWFLSDAEAATEWLSKQRPERAQSAVHGLPFDRILRRDLDAARLLAAKMPDSPTRRSYLASLLSATDGDVGSDWQAIPDGPAKRLALGDYATKSAPTNPQRSLALATALPSRTLKRQVATAVVTNTPLESLPEVLGTLDQIGDPLVAAQARVKGIRRMGAENPLAALEYAAQNFDSELKPSMMLQVIEASPELQEALARGSVASSFPTVPAETINELERIFSTSYPHSE